MSNADMPKSINATIAVAEGQELFQKMLGNCVDLMFERFPNDDLRDKQLWALLAFMKGACRSANEADRTNHPEDERAWDIFEQAGYSMTNKIAQDLDRNKR